MRVQKEDGRGCRFQAGIEGTAIHILCSSKETKGILEGWEKQAKLKGSFLRTTKYTVKLQNITFQTPLQ